MKDKLINLIAVITVSLITSGITVYASNYLFASNIVSYDNTTSGIRSGNVQGAIDELYACASDYSSINTRVTNIENQIYPVGSIYISVSNTNPSTLFGGTWESYASGRTLVGINTSDSDFNTIGKTGGNKTHQHLYGLQYGGYFRDTIIEGNSNAGLLNYSDSSNFSVTGGGTSVGSLSMAINGGTTSSYVSANVNVAHYRITANTSATSNLQPYITVYMWKRTA